MKPDSHKNPDSPMDPDKYQQAWQADDAQARITVDADLLLKEVQRNQQNFFAQILRRDIIEIGVGLLLLPYWFYMGATSSLPWTWYLTVPAILWIVGFFLVDRIRYPQKLSKPGEPLLSCVKNSLSQVEHQIWLLRNIFWWYLLPPTISILAFFAHVAWLASEDWLDTLSHAGNFVFLFAVYFFVYWLNQRAVDSDLEPRRQELLTLLASLGDDSTAMSRVKSTQSSRKLRRWTFVAVSCLGALVVAALASGIFDSNYDGTSRSSGPAGDSLEKLVTDQRKEKKLVGLAAMVMIDGQLEAVAADGERKHGSGVSLELGDRWHLGGITKSITATMIARLVESGQMQWSDTVGELFSKTSVSERSVPEASIHEDWKPVTIRQLLTHTAGAKANFSLQVRRKQPALGPECTQARREAVLHVIADPPTYPPGEKYVFSNVGYTIAGAMAEKVTGVSWEELVKREVFEPLKLTGAGFGPPTRPDQGPIDQAIGQPRGHRTFLHGKVAVGDKADNTSIMGPAGTIHMTLNDLCTYATEHLRGALGEGQLLSAKTYQLLHTPDLNQYACGWMKQKPRAESPYTVYLHNGSNTMWYALVVFIPETKMVVAVTSNDGDLTNAEAAAWEVVKANVPAALPNRGPVQQTEYPKKSPFAAVRWQPAQHDMGQPEVKVGKEWYQLVSLDDLPTEKILAFSRETFGNKWRKRFEEDLVELLSLMGHTPQDTVKLVVQSLTSSEPQILEGISMTEANRRAIWEAGSRK